MRTEFYVFFPSPSVTWRLVPHRSVLLDVVVDVTLNVSGDLRVDLDIGLIFPRYIFSIIIKDFWHNLYLDIYKFAPQKSIIIMKNVTKY